MKKVILLSTAALLAALASSPALGYTISGTVWFDQEDGWPAPCCDVWLYNGDDCQSWKATDVTDDGGGYLFDNIPDGDYSIKVHWRTIQECASCTAVGTNCDGVTLVCDPFNVQGNTVRNYVLGLDCHCCEHDPQPCP